MTRNVITEVPDHSVTADELADTWTCACGVGGAPDLSLHPRDALTRAEDHQRHTARRLVPLLTEAQVARALQGTAENNSRERAAVELLVHHDYWLGNGYFRAYLNADWVHGTFWLRVDWRRVALGLDQPGRAIQALTVNEDVDESLSPQLRARMTRLAMDLKQWRHDRDNESLDGGAAYNGCPLLKASTSEVAYLRWACSIASDGLVYLNGDTANLGNAGRRLFLTALAHLLTHGGNLTIGQAADSWSAFDAARRVRHEDEPTPLDTVQALFPVNGPHSAELTSQAGSVLTEIIRFLNYATMATAVEYPGTIYDVIGSAHRAAAMLDQTLQQSATRLTEFAQHPHAALRPASGDERWPDKGSPPATAAAVTALLRAARVALGEAQSALRDAHVYAGRLGLDLPDDE
jgi:hypothetical protein